MRRDLLCTLGPVVLAAPLAWGQHHVLVERFDSGTNNLGWAFNGGTQSVVATGGNYTGYLQAADITVGLPIVWINDQSLSAFTGNMQQHNALVVGVDLAVFAADAPIGTRLPNLLLYSDNGTPNDPSDDWIAYSINHYNPPVRTAGAGWQRAMFQVPVNSSTWPSDWHYLPQGPNAPALGNWGLLITNTRELGFAFGDPGSTYSPIRWTIGADNTHVWSDVGTDCFANCDGSTTPPILNVNDFMCYLNRWATFDPAANCTAYWNPPYRLGDDFGCFMNTYASGCP